MNRLIWMGGTARQLQSSSLSDYASDMAAWLFESSETLEATEIPDAIGTSDRPVQAGRAYAHDGVSNRIEYTVAAQLNGATKATISFWAWQLQPAVGRLRLGTETVDHRMQYVQNSGDTYIICDTGSGQANWQLSSPMSASTWQHIVLVYDGSLSGNDTRFKLYLDKVRLYKIAESGTIPATLSITDTLFTNGSSGGGQTGVDKRTRDLRVWSGVALTEAEIAQVYDGEIVQLASQILGAWCDEGAGTTSYNWADPTKNGTIFTGDAAAMHYEDTTDPLTIPYSHQDEVGYSDGAGGSLVPRDESDPTKDVLGAALDYSGRVRYDGIPVGSHCATTDGVGDVLAVADLVGTESVTSSGGTATPTVGAGEITFDAGTCWNLVLDSGHIFTFSEGDGLTAYNIGTGNDGTWTTSDEPALHAGTQDSYHHNWFYGFRLSSGVKIPALTDGSLAADGNAITNPAGTFHNGCETKVGLPIAPALRNARDAVISEGRDPDAMDMSALTKDANSEHYLMHDRSDTDEMKNMLVFEDAPTGATLTTIQRLLNH